MNSKRKSVVFLILVVFATLAVIQIASAGPQSCDNRVNNTHNKLLECVTVDGVREHQAAFQAAADANSGTRASGTGGYDDSAAYVAERMAAAGYDVEVLEFDFGFFEETGPSSFDQASPVATSYVNQTDYDVMTFSGSGTTGTVDFVGIDLALGMAPWPADPSTSTSGCEASDFDPPAASVVGKIAVVQRGACNFSTKAINAEAAGAVGVVIFNQGNNPGRLGLFFGTLGGPVGTIPVVSTSFAIGQDLSTSNATGSITTSTISETRTTSNVIAESKRGDPTNVVMAGAHLDSVSGGPGIQDNGSGSAVLIEIAEQMAKVKPVNQVRFAWWGAEELGLVGSIDYIVSLTDEEHANIALYLNFDMVGSPNFVRFVYDGDNSDGGNTIFVPPESAVIEQLFLDYYASQGLPNQGTLLGQRSDHFAFCVTGIPCGGLFTGAEGIKTVGEAALYGGTAGDQYDPCYHTACDTFANISLTALDQNSDAAAFAILTYAMNTESINGTPGKGNFSPEVLDNPGHSDYR